MFVISGVFDVCGRAPVLGEMSTESAFRTLTGFGSDCGSPAPSYLVGTSTRRLMRDVIVSGELVTQITSGSTKRKSFI